MVGTSEGKDEDKVVDLNQEAEENTGEISLHAMQGHNNGGTVKF